MAAGRSNDGGNDDALGEPGACDIAIHRMHTYPNNRFRLEEVELHQAVENRNV